MANAGAMKNMHKLRYSEDALNTFREDKPGRNLENLETGEDSIQVSTSDKASLSPPILDKWWATTKIDHRPPAPQTGHGRHIGTYALTTELAPWVKTTLSNHRPTEEVLQLIQPYASVYQDLISDEKRSSSGLHDIDTLELVLLSCIEVGAAILLAADTAPDPVKLSLRRHLSRADSGDHLKPWGRLLTNREYDPPIFAIFPFYLLMCQSFIHEPMRYQEDYMYSILTGIDWASGGNSIKEKLAAFIDSAQLSVPTMDDNISGQDKCLWRIGNAYLQVMMSVGNSRPFNAPEKASIDHGLHPDLVIMARAFDSMGLLFSSRDGAAWLDDEGLDSLLVCALANDVGDLHRDIFAGETRNLLRLLYPPGYSIQAALATNSILLSGVLCAIFRGHRRAFARNREDASCASASPGYSFSQARRRRIFETLELYINKYPQFWDWTWEIYNMAKSQITDAGIAEPLVCCLKRAANQGQLPPSDPNHFFKRWYDMIEDDSANLSNKEPLGVPEDMASTVRDIHSLWHGQLLETKKKPGWGRRFDDQSDMLLGQAGEILASRNSIPDASKFAAAYGMLGMSLPYVAHHTVDAIIMAFGAIPPV